MKKLKRLLSKLPPWSLTVVVVAAILWLTLAPRPLGDEDIPWFPGADKIAHAIMFGGLALVILIDYERSHGWRRITLANAYTAAVISSLAGAAVEMGQVMMGLGRSFEWNDILADALGAFIFAWGWVKLSPKVFPEQK